MSNNTKSGCSGNTHTTAQMNHHANQNNPKFLKKKRKRQ